MKKLFFPAVLSLFVVFFSCDKVDNPFPQIDTVDTTNINVNFNDTVVVASNGLRRILLEDYTGHECGNCPQAAEIAEDLLVQYPNQLSLLAVHAGHFAEPDPFDPKYALDLTTEDGDLYDSEFGNSAKGNPNGLINRTQDQTGNYVVKPAQWTTIVDSLVNSTTSNNPEIDIEVTSIYNTEQKTLRLLSNVAVNQNLNGNYNQIAFLHEAGIIGNHKLYQGGQTLVIENYEFKHVLRKALPTSWGKQLIIGNASANTNLEDEIAYNIPDDFVPENLGVIVCVFEETTKEIIQTVEIKHIVK